MTGLAGPHPYAGLRGIPDLLRARRRTAAPRPHTAAHLAATIGYSYGHTLEVLRGDRPPTDPFLRACGRVLAADLYALCGLATVPVPPPKGAPALHLIRSSPAPAAPVRRPRTRQGRAGAPHVE